MTSGRVDTNTQIPDTSEDIKLHAKRLAMSAGSTVAVMYLKTKGLDHDGAWGLLYSILSTGNHDDIKMSKCLHCVFRKCCNYAPYSCGCSLDDRTPIWKVNFRFTPTNSPECDYVRTYESGWAEIYDPQERRARVVQMSPNNLTLMIDPSPQDLSAGFLAWSGTTLRILDRPEGRFILRGVLPLKDETYQSYQERVAALVKRASKRISTKTNDVDRLKAVFNAIGQGQLLNDMYGGDAIAMAADYFPYKKISDIIADFNVTEATDDNVRKEAIEARKQATRRTDQ